MLAETPQGFAAGMIGADRTSTLYRSRRGDAAALRGRLRELARQRRRFGYRRVHILLLPEIPRISGGDGVRVNRKRTQRLYTEEGLTVRKRKSRRRAVGVRAPLPVLALPNERWSLDFVHDPAANPLLITHLPQPFSGRYDACVDWIEQRIVMARNAGATHEISLACCALTYDDAPSRWRGSGAYRSRNWGSIRFCGIFRAVA